MLNYFSHQDPRGSSLCKMPFNVFCLFSFLLLAHSTLGQDTLLSKVEVGLSTTEYWSNGQLNPTFKHLDTLEFYQISYLSDGHKVNGLMVEPKAPGKYPVIIFNRGGNRDFGRLSIGTLISYTSKLAADGFVILASNYRDNDEFGGAEINDVLKLIDVAATLTKADTSRIGMFGWSRGGMMSYLAMAKTDRLKTVVVGNGPTDLLRTLEERPILEENVFSQCIPNYWTGKSEALKERSVIHWAHKLCPNTSLLILAGTQDKRVSHIQAERLSQKLKTLNLEHELKLFETNHFFSNKKDILHQELIQWFNATMKR